MTRKTTVLVAALLVVAAIAGWLVFRPRDQRVTVPEDAAAGDLTMTPCSIKVDGVEYQAECGTLVVPEYRTDPQSRLIAIPVRRILAPSQSLSEPILWLGGGPGMTNMGEAARTWLLENHDFIQIGYRGVDGTPVLDCPCFARAALGQGDDLLAPESLDAIGEAAAACAEDLEAEGVDLRGYTIPEVINDMEDARRALGYERVNLLSASYGTRVAQIYAQIYPASLNRSAMIGVNPPGHFLWLPDVVDSQVEYYAELCRRDSDCAWNTIDLAAVMQRVNSRMPTRWMGIHIDPGRVRLIAFALLYHRTTAPMVFDAYVAADSGDASGLALMSLAYRFVVPHMMTWGEFLALGNSADFEPGRDYRSDLARPDAILGAPMSEFIWGSAPGYWPSILMPDEYRHVQATGIETLLVSGSIDSATPARFAENELLPALQNGHHVVIAEQGHTGDFWKYQPEAAARLLTGFFDTGTPDDSLYQYLPMEFDPPLRFPVLAKLAVILLVVIVVGLGLVIWLIVRRARRAARA
jgi:pimeloyl-ACP methyl ester carboxylesterase